MNRERKIYATLARFKAGRKGIAELLLFAVGLALAVNLISAAIISYLNPILTWVSALFALLACFVIGIKMRLSSRSEIVCIEAGVAIDNRELCIVDTIGYEFGNDVARVARAAFRENRAFWEQWKSYPPELGNHSLSTTANEHPGFRLLREICEASVLLRLSNHLADFFSNRDLGELVVLGRNDLSDVILQNRVLELISRDLHDRIAFKEYIGEFSLSESVVSSSRESGELYEKISLTLPDGSRVAREGDCIVIENKWILISLLVHPTGVSASFSPDFLECSTGRGFDEVSTFEMHIEAAVKVKWHLLLSRRGISYHEWLESFFDQLASECDVRENERRLKWPMINIMLEFMKHRSARL